MVRPYVSTFATRGRVALLTAFVFAFAVSLTAANETAVPAYDFAGQLQTNSPAAINTAAINTAAMQPAGYFLIADPTPTPAPENAPAEAATFASESAAQPAPVQPPPVAAYDPPHASAWTWPGFPSIAALRTHLLTDIVNHGLVNDTEAKRQAILAMDAEELQAVHASDHETRLDHNRIEDVPSGTQMVNFVADDCPSGNCPTGYASVAMTVGDCPTGNCGAGYSQAVSIRQPLRRLVYRSRRVFRFRCR